ncbi:MAG TPA: 5'-3' exonuclease H3TH domain-containing protein [Patescibacteria group bacterium]|nr:5'-3' exonuclease H3TH domain-containing protein [Patescibacteria group bacterium]
MDLRTKKLVVIDGNAILHRAYHALPPLTDPKGEVVNAVYGFFSMLLNLLQNQKPDYLAVCFDRSKPTIRQSMYVGYHAHRPQMADDFVSQIARVDYILEKMAIKPFFVDGFEADDVIGTIATLVQRARNKEQGIETIVVTGDRDLLQLVNEHTKVLMLITGITKTVLFDEKAVEGKYGVTPKQFIDYKALIGDQSDGYPGVAGIGPKTAAILLQKYQTFENLYEHVGELSERQGLQLATDAEQAALAKKLATIICDIPMQFNIEKCKASDFDLAGLEKAFEEFGFNSLKKRLLTVFPDLDERKKKKKDKVNKDQMSLL